MRDDCLIVMLLLVHATCAKLGYSFSSAEMP